VSILADILAAQGLTPRQVARVQALVDWERTRCRIYELRCTMTVPAIAIRLNLSESTVNRAIREQLEMRRNAA
jgi:predicted transcriptional regulator